jgi:glucose/arabinose dehydrogenase
MVVIEEKMELRRLVIPAALALIGLAACLPGGPGESTPTLIPMPTPPAPTAPPASDTAVPTEEPQPTAADVTPTTGPTNPTDEPTVEPTTPPPEPDLDALNLGVEPVAEGFNAPTGIASAGDGSGRLFIVEKAGTIRVFDGGSVLPEPFLDIHDRVNAGASEQGLLGLAFHPNYTENGYFFVNYTDGTGGTVISRFSVTDDPNRADPASEEVVLTQAQPARNHNGGNLVFGPDGYLYIGLGDGGASGDRFGNGQNLGTLLGAMLRIDVNELPYSIPPDNPFVDDPNALDEIWAYGLRNPWRYSFDRATGDLYIADVGQNVYEEVDFQPADSAGGENYGWPIMEGLHCYPEGANCDPAGLVQPVAEYDHTEGCSVTGGYVYRGERFPAMQGVYFFGDYCSGLIWGLAPTADGWNVRQLASTNASISSFGQAEDGEVYFVDLARGTLSHLIAQ